MLIIYKTIATLWFWSICVICFTMSLPLSILFGYNTSFNISFKMCRLLSPIKIKYDKIFDIQNTIVISNHSSIIDWIIILMVFPNSVFIAKHRRIFDILFVFKYVMTEKGNLLFKPGNTYNIIKDWVIQSDKNNTIWIFPQGGRRKTKTHTGIFSIAKSLNKKMAILEICDIDDLFSKNGINKKNTMLRIPMRC